MKYSHLFISAFIFCILVLLGCEQTVDTGELPFEEKIMVDGILKADSVIEIIFSKTIPVLDTQDLYNVDSLQLRITSLQGTITIDEAEYPLIHISNGRYRIFDTQKQPIKGKIGAKYILYASWNGKIINAETKIPEAKKPDILHINIDTNRSALNGYQDFIRVFVSLSYHPEDNEATVHSIQIHTNSDKPTEFYEIDTLNNKEFDYPLYSPPYYFTKKEIPHISSFYFFLDAPSSLPISEILTMYADSRIITKHYDKAMKEYIDTQYYGDNLGGIFGGGGTGIHWNIKGQGLGLFIGYSENILPLPLQ